MADSKHVIPIMDVSKNETTQLSNEDAQKVIDAVEPLIKTNMKRSIKPQSIKPKSIKPKSINLDNEQPLHVTLENGNVMTFTSAASIPK